MPRLLTALAAGAAIAGLLAAPGVARAQEQQSAGCYPNNRIELYAPKINIFTGETEDVQLIGLARDAQWLAGCAACECGDVRPFQARVIIAQSSTPPAGTGLLSLIVGTSQCWEANTPADIRAQFCVDIGGGARPFAQWVNSGAGVNVDFNPGVFAFPDDPNSCDPTRPPTGAGFGIYLIPDFGSATPGQPYLSWTTCEASSSGGGPTVQPLQAIPARLFAPLPPTNVRVTPGKSSLNVTWDVPAQDTEVFQYQVLCRRMDNGSPGLAAEERPAAAFATGRSLCGATPRCTGYSAGGGSSVPIPDDGGDDEDDGGFVEDDQDTLGTTSLRPRGGSLDGGLDLGAPDGGTDAAAGGDAGPSDAGPSDADPSDGGPTDGGAADGADAPAIDPEVAELIDPQFVCSDPIVKPGNSVTLRNLVNDVPYELAVIAINQYGNASTPAIIIGTPQDSLDFYQVYRNAGGTSQGGYCFVATAAYGSYDHPMVRTLRAFRDHILLPHARLLVDGYYRLSPPLARAIEGAAWRRAAARAVLWPVVGLAAVWLRVGSWAMLLGMLALGLGLWRWRRARRQARALRLGQAAT